MKIKKLLSAFLLLFILFSISFLVYKEILQKSYSKGNTVAEVQTNKESENYTAPPQKQSAQEKKVDTRETVTTKAAKPEVACDFQGASCDSTSKAIAYYFHGTSRCTTCRTIERYSKEAIDNIF